MFRNPLFQFLIVVIIISTYSVVMGTSLDSSFIQLNGMLSGQVPSSTPSPRPTPELPPAVQGTSVSSESAQVVTEVIDGDTIRLATGETLRYIGIDTPETRHPQIERECFGSEASRRNEELVLGKTVLLETDVNDKDRYGRLLRYVWLDGVMVNETLVKEGFATAKAYRPDIKYQFILDAAEREARENNRGMWNVCANSQ